MTFDRFFGAVRPADAIVIRDRARGVYRALPQAQMFSGVQSPSRDALRDRKLLRSLVSRKYGKKS